MVRSSGSLRQILETIAAYCSTRHPAALASGTVSTPLAAEVARKGKDFGRNDRADPQGARENRLWGAERIRGELLKLGMEVSKRTIQKYMPKDRKSYVSSQTWATFLKNQAGGICACDFTVMHDWLFRSWYIFVVLDLKTRPIVHTGVTKFLTDDWTAQQVREATPWGKGPRYLIRGRDRKYAAHFSAMAASSGIQELKTPYRVPQVNGACERFIGSMRRECLDHIFIHQGRHLQQVVQEYMACYNQERPHQGIGQRIPAQYDLPDSKPASGRIVSKAILGGLHQVMLARRI